MCGRASLTKNEKELEERFGSTFYTEDIERYNPVPNYNLAPSQYLPVISNEDGGHFNIFKWGLIPFWSKDAKIAYKLINARAETLDTSQAFKNAFKKRRCLIPLDGFYEWDKISGSKKPFRITLKDDKIFSVAGIWDEWKDEKNEKMSTFSIITVEANGLVGQIHNRMPAILSIEEERLWLSEDLTINDLKCLLKPLSDEVMRMYPVSERVNNVRNNDRQLIEEIGTLENPNISLF